MRPVLVFLAMVMLMLSTGASAKRAQDPQGLFSVDIPDHWKYNPPDWGLSSSGSAGSYSSADGNAVISLRSYDLDDMSLDAWARHAASGPFDMKIYNDTLNSVAAKRLQWKMMDGATKTEYLGIHWLAKKGRRGAAINFSYPRWSNEDIKRIRKSLTSSFRWQ